MLKPEDIEKCCTTCKYIEYFSCSTDSAYCSGQKDAPHILCPDHYVCDHYKNMMYKTDSLEEVRKLKEDKTDMIVSPFKEVSVPKTIFNEDYWKVGDAYVIKKHDEKPKFYVLEIVIEMSYVKMNNGVTISVEEFHNGNYELINHISLDYACSKSMSGE